MSKWTHVEINEQNRVVSRFKRPSREAVLGAYRRGHRVVALPEPGAVLLGSFRAALPVGSHDVKP